MPPISFTLKPFEASESTQNLFITGTVAKTSDSLSFIYTLAGDLAAIAVPSLDLALSPANARQDRLWEKTCFEFFLAAGTQHSKADPYWEFNLSPAGYWNVFALANYRQGLRLEPDFSSLPFTVKMSPNTLQLEISADISQIVNPSQPLRLGVSAVIVSTAGEESFWAVVHPGFEADFHHPDSFAIAL